MKIGITNLRKFLSSDERVERKRLDLMEDEVNAEQDVFISKDHQRALAMDEDDKISAETRLIKGDEAPPPATTDDVSEMTGYNRESKAKAYAEIAVNEVAKQYTATILTMLAILMYSLTNVLTAASCSFLHPPLHHTILLLFLTHTRLLSVILFRAHYLLTSTLLVQPLSSIV